MATETHGSAKSRHLRLIVVAVLITVVFGAGTFGITHWVVSRSDAYAAADRHLRISTELAAIIGPVKATRLSWLEHTAVEELEINGRPSGNAEFTVIAEGNSGSLAIPIQLTRDEKGWTVMSAVAGRQVLTPGKK